MWRERLIRRLESRRVPPVVAVVAFLLALPSLTLGYLLDDRYHEYYFRGGPIPGAMRGPWDLYRFADGTPEIAHAIARGIYPWWTAPRLKIAFFRPIPSLWRWLDFHLFGSSPLVPHLETCLVYAALAFVVAKLYGRWIGGAAAGLAAFAFAFDDAHGMPVAWIANRYAVLAGLFGFGAVLAHVQARSRTEPTIALRALSAVLLALALASGEVSLGVLGYLLGYALFVDTRGKRSALVSLLPHGAVVLAWAIVYRALDYGAAGGGMYIDPLHSPILYLKNLVVRMPELLLSGTFLPPSEIWPLVPPERAWLAAVIATCIVCLVVSFIARVAIAGDRERRGHVFAFLFGSLVATLPVCAMMPDDRNFLVAGFGFFGVLGMAIARVWRERGAVSRAGRAGAWALVVVHLVLAPLLFPLRSVSAIKGFTTFINRGAASLPSNERSAEKTYVMVSVPDALFIAYVVLERLMAPGPYPHGYSELSVQGIGKYTLKCIDEDTVEIANPEGDMHSPFVAAFTDVPFAPGQTFETDVARMEIRETTSKGEPSVLRATIHTPRDERIWLVWKDTGFVEIPAPSPGEETAFEATDIFTAMQK